MAASDNGGEGRRAMRWLVGWSSATTRGAPADGGTVHPVGAQLLWGDPDPLWAVGDWRPDEVRVIDDAVHRPGSGTHPRGGTGPGGGTSGGNGASDSAPPRAVAPNSLAVLGSCGASDDELRAGLNAARGGAFRHLTAWPGSYTAVVRIGRRLTIAADLAGVRPVFHTPWAGGTAYATAALPLADLIEAQLDIGHLGALLACPDAPEALGDGTPYAGVRRVPPGHALIVREGGSREIIGYEPAASLAVSPPTVDPDAAVAGVREALVESVRARMTAPRHMTDPTLHGGNGDLHPYDSNGTGTGTGAGGHNGTSPYGRSDRDPGPVPGMGPADRRAARGAPAPAPGVGADLSGGPASATLALLAAGLPGMPGTVHGADDGTQAGARLLAVTFNDLAVAGPSARESERERERARTIADTPRLHHLVVTGTEEALPYARLTGPLTDEPGPSLVAVDRDRQRLAAGSADHFVGHGARQALDAHPARLADLLLDRRRRHLLRPVAALARAEDTPPGRAVRVPWTVYRAARRLARTPYRDGVLEAALRLREGRFAAGAATADGSERGRGRDGRGTATAGPGKRSAGNAAPGSAVDASVAALSWCRPGPAARWLTGEALAEVAARLETAATLRPVSERPGERRARAALARQAADYRTFEQAAENRGQRLHAPFFDNQVVRACRALPEALRVRPGARGSVLRSVLAGAGVRELPPGWGAPTPGAGTAAQRAGLRAAADALLDLFDAPLLADAGLIEARVVRNAVRAAAKGAPSSLDGLAELVSTELWLRRLLARRGTCWTGTAAPRRRAAFSGVAPPAPRRSAL